MLTDSQKSAVAEWYAAGATPDAIQKRLKSEFGVSLRHLDLMLLLQELPVPVAPESADDAVQNDDPNPAQAEQNDSTDSASAQPGVSVEFDAVTDPRYAASGTVTFSDGTSCQWLMDARGQLAFRSLPQGYQPTPEDAQSFQRELVSGLQARGLL